MSLASPTDLNNHHPFQHQQYSILFWMNHGGTFAWYLSLLLESLIASLAGAAAGITDAFPHVCVTVAV